MAFQWGELGGQGAGKVREGAMADGSREGFWGRTGLPVAGLCALLAGASLAYDHAWRIPDHAVHQAVATVAIILYFGAFVFGALFVYVACARRGASRGERILACAIVPLLWMTKEVIRVGTVWPLPDALFYYLNPLHRAVALAAISEMGIAELWLRRRRRRAGEALRVLAPGPVTAALLPFLYLLFQAPPERGAASFFDFLRLYTRIVHGTSLDY